MDHVAAMFLLRWRESRFVFCLYEHICNSLEDLLEYFNMYVQYVIPRS